MHPLLTKRIEIPWSHVRKIVLNVFAVVAAAVVMYVLSAPPIMKAIWQAQIKQSHGVHWPKFYAPLLLGIENNSPVTSRAFKWYFNTVWGCGILTFDDVPPGQDRD